MLIGISIYLMIGAVFAVVFYKYLDNKIGEYEEGELDSETESVMKELQHLARVMGGQGFIIFLFVVSTIFWLPMLIFTAPKK